MGAIPCKKPWERETNKRGILRGIDEKYVYELNRDANVVENMPTLAEVLQDGELARHAKVVEKARELGYGYRRKKR